MHTAFYFFHRSLWMLLFWGSWLIKRKLVLCFAFCFFFCQQGKLFHFYSCPQTPHQCQWCQDMNRFFLSFLVRCMPYILVTFAYERIGWTRKQWMVLTVFFLNSFLVCCKCYLVISANGTVWSIDSPSVKPPALVIGKTFMNILFYFFTLFRK